MQNGRVDIPHKSKWTPTIQYRNIPWSPPRKHMPTEKPINMIAAASPTIAKPNTTKALFKRQKSQLQNIQIMEYYSAIKRNETLSLGWGWKDGLLIKDSSCSCRGQGFHSQHPHGCSQLSITTAPVDLMPSSDIRRHSPGVHACSLNMHPHKIKTKETEMCISR